MKFLRTHFNTSSALQVIPPYRTNTSCYSYHTQNTKAPVLLVRAKDDTEIPNTHSQALFEAFIKPLLPEVPVSPADATFV